MNRYQFIFRTLALISLVFILNAKISDFVQIEFKDDPYTLNSSINYTKVSTDLNGSEVNAIIEIPAGTVAKWEVDKNDGKLKWEFKKGKPRKVKYLGYPANYGMVPGTLLSKENGGDGDPLDVIILGPSITRGKIVKVKILGVLYLLDGGEQDDKIIAAVEESPFYALNDISELDKEFNGITEIISFWFENYKGPGGLKANGFGGRDKALSVLEASIVK